jgi:imidazolonepropionase-like amidohydrolase
MRTNFADSEVERLDLKPLRGVRAWTNQRLGGKPLHLSVRWTLAVVGLVLAVPSSAAPTILPAARQQKPIILSGGKVVTVSGATLEKADVLFVDGRITQVAAKITPPAGAEIIDITGRSVYPGLIAAQTQLGLMEIKGARQTNDVAEIGPINPNARAQTALNPESEHLPVTRANGILTALSLPADRVGTGSRPNLIAGTSTLIRLDGWTWEDLTIRSAVAMHVYWPAMRSGTGSKAGAAQAKGGDTQTRMLDDAFVAARAYAKAKASGQGAVETDVRWEAMLPVLRGEQRVFVHADELKQIRAALAFARKHQLAITMVGGLDAWRVAEELKAADVPVIIGGTERLPGRRDDDYEAAYANPARLHAAGVRFCIAGRANDLGHERNLGVHAARAAAHGLPKDVALRSVTLSAAELLGVGAELGSIEPGKRATLIVTDGDPLEIPTQVKLAFIDGAKIDLSSKHTQLYEKYNERLRRLDGTRPAGARAADQ